jgi:hypothetical protein
MNESERTSRGSTPRWKDWAIGLEVGNKWHLFRITKGEWRQQRVVNGISKGRQAKLMVALAEGGGFLARDEAVKLERSTFSGGEIDTLMGKIKPEISKLRGVIRTAIGVNNPKADPLPFDDAQVGWRAEIEIGYAEQEDGEHLGGERRLRFKTYHELTKDERADR